MAALLSRHGFDTAIIIGVFAACKDLTILSRIPSFKNNPPPQRRRARRTESRIYE
jgi:hypothetical protein